MSEFNPIGINIVLETLPFPQATFGMPLVVGTGDTAIEYAEVSKESYLVLLGYSTTDSEYKKAAAFFSQNPRPEKIAVYRKATATSYADALNAVKIVNNKWYGILSTSRAKADLQAIGTWAESNKKLFIGTTSDQTVIDDRNLNREAYLLHTDANTTEHDAILAGSCMTFQPGRATWAYKRGVGATNSGYNSTETNSLIDGNANLYVEMGSQIVSYPGKVTSGEFIDIIVSRDYVEARIIEELQRLLIITPKIPYTLEGFAQVESVLRSVLRQAGVDGIVAPVSSDDDKTRSDLGDYQYQIIIPETLSEIPANDRANRKMPIQFKFRIAGAIHLFDIDGSITV